MIKVQSVYSVSFHSDNLASAKYRKIKDVAFQLLEERNKLSRWTQDNILQCLELSKFDYAKVTLSLVNHFSSHFYQKLQSEVYTAYSNRFETIKKKLSCYTREHVKTEYYKRDTKINKKGEVKRVIYKDKSTDVTKTVSYLTKYGEQASYPENIQRVVDKCKNAGFYERLVTLARERRERILSKYSEPINFTSLTFRGVSRLTTDIVSKNRNKNSIIHGFVTLSWVNNDDARPLKIPVKLHSKYHGNLKDYDNGKYTSYIIQVQRSSVRIILTRDGVREYPDISLNPDEIEGIDVNTKHNMWVSSGGYEVKHHFNLVNAIINHEKETDRLRNEHKNYKLGKRRQAKSIALSKKYLDYIEREVATYCKDLVRRGIKHLVAENLEGCWRKMHGNATQFDVNQNRISKAMQIASIKDAFLHIAPRHGIAVSLVNPAYTSQTCPRCGCVHKNNRITQETFKCVECGYKNNADAVSAGNVRHRISDAVLREKLSVLNKTKTGFIPNKIKYKEIKPVLEKLGHIVCYKTQTKRTILESINNRFW